MTITPITTGPGDPPKSDETRHFNGQLDGAKAAQKQTEAQKEEPKSETPEARYVPHGEDLYRDTQTGKVVGWPQGNGG
jgi:hypothetical protein